MAKDTDELFAEGEAKLKASQQLMTGNNNLVDSAIKAKDRGYFPEIAAGAGAVGAAVYVDKKLTKNTLEATKKIVEAIKAENALVNRLDNSKSQPFAKPKAGVPLKVVNKTVEMMTLSDKKGNFAPASRLGTVSGATLNGEALANLSNEQRRELAKKMGVEKLLKYVGEPQTATTAVANPKAAFDARGTDQKVARYVTTPKDVADARSAGAKPVVVPPTAGSKVGNAFSYLGKSAWNTISHPYVTNTLKGIDIGRTAYNAPENAGIAMDRAAAEGLGPVGKTGAAIESVSGDAARLGINLRSYYVPEMLGLYDMANIMKGDEKAVEKVSKSGGGVFGFIARGLVESGNKMAQAEIASSEKKLGRKLTEKEIGDIQRGVNDTVMSFGAY